ncbi:MAG: SDR family NAD(P)-dependent oxidoreductase [Dehalococcoidia bacterium]
MARLDGKAALVTGGGRGIGKGICEVLAREGAAVVVTDIDGEAASATATEIARGGKQATGFAMDVTSDDSVAAGIERAINWRGHLDILVNNAGVVGSHVGGSMVTEHDWDQCYEVNLKGIWRVSRALVGHFRERGGGKIVNIASIAGRVGGAGLSHYSASKAGAISLTQSLAAELGRLNVNVNAVCPGLLWTEMWRTLEALITGSTEEEVVNRREAFERYIAANCPLGREQTPEDIGHAVAFLASEEARNITGQALNVDGGIRMN